MTAKETYQYLIQIQFSGYLISFDNDSNEIKVAQDIDYEQAHIYFCYSYTYKPDDMNIIEKQIDYVLERVNHKEKLLKQLNNDKQIEELNKDFS